MLVPPAHRRLERIDELISPAMCAQLDRLDIISRRVFAGRLHGERRSKRRGQSVEFEDYRQYVPGDDLRFVDWNVYARLDKFFIRIFQEEEDLSFHVVIDASASMEAGAPVKLPLAQRLAMSLAYIALARNDRVTASAFDGRRLRTLSPLRGRRNASRVGQFILQAARPASATEPDDTDDTDDAAPQDAPPRGAPAPTFTAAARALARSRTGKGVMAVLSDFLFPEGYREGLALLAGGGFDTFCLQVLSPGELDPAAELDAAHAARQGMMGDVRLSDVETGRDAEVTVTADVLRRYRERVAAYIDDLNRFCVARGMTHILIRSNTDPESLLLDLFRKRGLLR